MHIVSSWISSNPLRLPWRTHTSHIKALTITCTLLVPFALPSNEVNLNLAPSGSPLREPLAPILPENLEGIESPMNFVVVLVSFLSIASVIAWTAYALSPVARLRRRARKTVRNFSAAVEDLKNRSLSLRGALPQAAAKYKDDVRIARLRSIPIDELRNHRKGSSAPTPEASRSIHPRRCERMER